MTTETPPNNVAPTKRRRVAIVPLIVSLLLGCSPLILARLVGTWSYSPDQTTADRGIYLCYFMCFVCCLPIVFQVATENRRHIDRIQTWILFGKVTSFVFLASTLLMLRTMRFGPNNERYQAMLRIADNSLPLVNAIERYEQDHENHPPESLNHLIPDYLSSIPTTGVARYNEYQYRVNSDPMGTPGPVSRYVLQVHTIEFGKWDTMTYLPDQNYDEMQPASAFDSIPMSDGRKWVYFNE